MCGLVASIRRGGRVDPGRFAAARRAIAHRGPDAAGEASVALADGEASFGHARLSIVDLDPRSHQPFRRARHLLVWNGEIYDHRRLAAGMELSTTGDTEVLLNLLARGGVEALRDANGMWAFCWLDEAKGRLVAGRDRYGKKPLFYAFSQDALHLASEPLALAALAGRPLAMGPEALDRFMADGWLFPDPSGATHLVGVSEVPPGQALTLDIARWTLDIRPAFPFPALEPAADPDRSEDRLAGLFADSVEARLLSERKMALLLSGGVDSSLILAALAHRGRLGDIACLIGDAGKDSDDSRYALAAAQAVGVEAVTVPMRYDALGLEVFLSACRAQAKPFPLIGNVLGMHQLYREAAARDIRVVLDGTGADEIFGGYWARHTGFVARDAAAAGDDAWRASIAPAMPRSFAELGEAEGWTTRREALPEADLALLRPDAHASIAATAPHDPLIGFGGNLCEALLTDALRGRMQEWLWQNDRNAMASGVENRSPFLDHRLIAWTDTPYSAKLAGPWNKRELRGLFARFAPLPTAERREKQGFRWRYTPFFRENREALLELIAGSAMARRCVDVGLFADAVRAGRITPDSRLHQRLAVVAGVEAAGVGFA